MGGGHGTAIVIAFVFGAVLCLNEGVPGACLARLSFAKVEMPFRTDTSRYSVGVNGYKYRPS